jgi:hypothetical protein
MKHEFSEAPAAATTWITSGSDGSVIMPSIPSDLCAGYRFEACICDGCLLKKLRFVHRFAEETKVVAVGTL